MGRHMVTRYLGGHVEAVFNVKMLSCDAVHPDSVSEGLRIKVQARSGARGSMASRIQAMAPGRPKPQTSSNPMPSERSPHPSKRWDPHSVTVSSPRSGQHARLGGVDLEGR